MAPAKKTVPLPAKLSTLVRLPQFFWFLGHFLSVFLFVLLQVVSFFSRPWTIFLYRAVLGAELVAYGIVVKQLGFFRRSAVKVQLLHDENVQYFVFAVVLAVASYKLGPWLKALYSYAIFSFFHVMAYCQSHLLEVMPIPIATQAAWSDRITYISANYNQQALYFAAMNEVFLLYDFLWAVPTLLFKIFRDPVYVVVQAALMVAVAMFLKLRYVHSAHTKTILAQLDARVSALLSHPVVPPALLQLYSVQFKGIVAAITDLLPTPVQLTKKTQ
ncbi:hypothetical protein PUMCH_004583 [Australozyma saopauloensis]|uniref:Pore membrane protein of 33 kDa n=1 Tax=Australozyma saopauloensis TaxID=291208 RepID=A0AAX4HF88_9ASCO|nr:hypothetical protein PUMCH_004583 [[Candida] saopauloensis]